MASNLVRLICPDLSCRKVLSVPPSARGKTVRCRNCGMRIHIPTDKTNKPAPPQPAESQAAEATDQAATE